MFKYKKTIIQKVIMVSLVILTPTISFSSEIKETSIKSSISKIFTNQNEILKIFNADINLLKLTSVDDFEFSIQDILRKYLNKTKVNKIINLISDTDNKTIQAKNIEEFIKILPKSSFEKINGLSIIRLANQLGKDAKTINKIKQLIILQIAKSHGTILVFKDGIEKSRSLETAEDESLNPSDAPSSMSTGLIAVAGIAAVGGGGGLFIKFIIIDFFG